MKTRTPGFWLIVATVGLLALLPMQGFSQSMTPADAKRFGENNADAFKGHDSAAEQGNAVAQYMLGARYYCSGFGGANEKDQREAMKWLHKASDQGIAEAQFLLAWCFRYGQCVAKDEVEALAYWKLTNLSGHTFRFPDAISLSPENHVLYLKRVKTLEREIAAKREAKMNDAYAKKASVPSPKPKTPEEQKLAAEKGDAEAQYMLGVRYYMTGMGGMNVKDQAEAIKWLRMASNQGHSYAQFMLAHCYESGQCVPMDKIEAYAYWKIGSLVNKSQLREGDPLTPDELRRGEQRAKELQKEIEAKIAAKNARK